MTTIRLLLLALILPATILAQQAPAELALARRGPLGTNLAADRSG